MKIRHLWLLAALQIAALGCAADGTGAADNTRSGPVHDDHAANAMGAPVTTSPGEQAGISGSESPNGITGGYAPGAGGYGESTRPKRAADQIQRPATDPSPGF